MDGLSDYLGRLHRLAQGALDTIDRRAREWFYSKPPRPPARARDATEQGQPAVFWEGYRQAIEDVTAYVEADPGLLQVPVVGR